MSPVPPTTRSRLPGWLPRWTRGEPRQAARALVAALAVCALSASAAPAEPANGGPANAPVQEDERPDEARNLGASDGLQVGAAFASLLYAPAKLVYAGTGALVGGLGWVFSGGDRSVASGIVLPAVRGDYVIAPEHLRGERRLRFVGRADPAARPTRTARAEPAPQRAASHAEGSSSPEVAEAEELAEPAEAEEAAEPAGTRESAGRPGPPPVSSPPPVSDADATAADDTVAPTKSRESAARAPAARPTEKESGVRAEDEAPALESTRWTRTEDGVWVYEAP